ncbi:MAG: hypothetical protein Q8N81_05065, partial [bacterium]|nr:hypothetical protein [bacterium]
KVPKARLFIAIDGKEPSGFSFGNLIVINLALIVALDTVDEVVSVLYHEQQHRERNWGVDSLEGGGLLEYVNEVSKRRLQEYEADLVTPKKLAGSGLNTSALADALCKIAGARSQQDVTHGNISRRVIANLLLHKHVDFEGRSGAQQAQQDTPIPADWTPETILASVAERLAGDDAVDFRRAVAEAPTELLLQTLKDYVKHRSSKLLTFNDRLSDRRYFITDYLRKRISDEAKKNKLSARTADALILSVLTKDIEPNDWVNLYLVLGSGDRKIKDILQQLAVSTLNEARQPDNAVFFGEFNTDAADIPIGSWEMGRALDFATRAFIYDKEIRNRLFRDGPEVTEDNYLSATASALWQFAVGQKEFFMAHLTAAIGWYVDNFWLTHSKDKANFLDLINRLKSANAYFQQLAGLSQQDVLKIYDTEVELKS